MMRRLLNKMALVTAGTFLLIFLIAPLAAADPIQDQINNGVDAAAGQSTGNPQQKVNTTIGNVVNLLSAVVGVVAVIMIIVGGFRYITSGGASEKVTGAKNTLLYAIIGLIIVALAQVLVRFVLNQVK